MPANILNDKVTHSSMFLTYDIRLAVIVVSGGMSMPQILSTLDSRVPVEISRPDRMKAKV
jgi:hypothetical protein